MNFILVLILLKKICICIWRTFLHLDVHALIYIVVACVCILHAFAGQVKNRPRSSNDDVCTKISKQILTLLLRVPDSNPTRWRDYPVAHLPGRSTTPRVTPSAPPGADPTACSNSLTATSPQALRKAGLSNPLGSPSKRLGHRLPYKPSPGYNLQWYTEPLHLRHCCGCHTLCWTLRPMHRQSQPPLLLMHTGCVTSDLLTNSYTGAESSADIPCDWRV